MFDRILVDPPCTNLGVLRHNPEVRYRTRRTGPAAFAQRQLQMLTSVAAVLKPGGTMLYSVCTVSREETSEAVSQFLAHHPQYYSVPIRPEELPWKALADPSGCFKTFPPPEGKPVDGFFAARLKRSM
jgi:16S rRNA (cytosine967-C5)-methyltransferase